LLSLPALLLPPLMSVPELTDAPSWAQYGSNEGGDCLWTTLIVL
jgi:hypothetical protein